MTSRGRQKDEVSGHMIQHSRKIRSAPYRIMHAIVTLGAFGAPRFDNATRGRSPRDSERGAPESTLCSCQKDLSRTDILSFESTLIEKHSLCRNACVSEQLHLVQAGHTGLRPSGSMLLRRQFGGRLKPLSARSSLQYLAIRDFGSTSDWTIHFITFLPL